MDTTKKPKAPSKQIKLFKNREEVFMVLVFNLLLGLVIFAYGVSRAMKDGYIVNLGGSPLITLVKLFWVVPFMVCMSLLYNAIHKRTSANGRFYAMSSYFVIFFTIFFIANYLGLEKLEISSMARFETDYPRFRPLWQSIHYWPKVLFYLHAEAIGTFMLSVLVWTFINAVMNVDQSKRLYSLLSLGGAIGTALAGSIVTMLAHKKQYLILLMIFSILALMLSYYLFARYRQSHPEFYAPLEDKKKKKKKLSFGESIRVIAQSPYLLLIGLLVFCYAAFMPLVEAIHKDFIKALADTPQAAGGVTYYTGIQLLAIGVFSSLLIVFVAPLASRFSWFFRAVLTPAVLFFFSIFFFAAIFFPSKTESVAQLFGLAKIGIPVTPAHLRVWAGMALVVVGKSFKYIFFDATKEGAYVPLDSETKVNAKAAIDGVIARVGKSAGASFVLVMTTLFALPNAIGVKNYIALALAVVVTCWLFTVFFLSGKYETLTSKTKDSLEAPTPPANGKASVDAPKKTKPTTATKAKKKTTAKK